MAGKLISSCLCDLPTGGANWQAVAGRPCSGAGVGAVVGGVWVDVGKQYEG